LLFRIVALCDLGLSPERVAERLDPVAVAAPGW
jgi:hypothetical protein